MTPTGSREKMRKNPGHDTARIISGLIEKIYDIRLPIINVGGRPFVLAV